MWPESRLGPPVSALAWCCAGVVLSSPSWGELSLDPVASILYLPLDTRDLHPGVGLQLEPCNVCAEWWDGCFSLQLSLACCFETPGNCPETVLLLPFQGIANPVLMRRSEEAL